MIFVSIDIETTGLDTENNQIISFGAVIEDTSKKLPFDQIPKFYAVIPHKQLIGSPTALLMNHKVIELIEIYNNGNKETISVVEKEQNFRYLEEDDLAKEFFDFLFLNGVPNDGFFDPNSYIRRVESSLLPMFNNKTKPFRINVAGKNFASFDKIFLEKLLWWKKLIRINQRILDPAILFCNWNEDETLPNLTECKKRAGIDGKVTHNALEDAWDVVTILRKNY